MSLRGDLKSQASQCLVFWSGMAHRIAFGLGMALLAGLAQSQVGPRLEFDVASIREVLHNKGKYRVEEPGLDLSGDRFTLQTSLKGIIAAAYGMKDHQISGPAWLDANAFQILAKAPPDTTEEQVRLMCQALLADRFKLSFHRTQRTMPVYALVPAKGGPKLSGNGDPASGAQAKIKSKPGRIASPRASMVWLADALARPLGRPVLDKTGIDGKFRIVLDWTPGDGEAQNGKPDKPKAAGRTGSGKTFAPSIFTALQEQLGLRLEPQKGMVDVLVIDHIEREPTEN